MHRTWMAVLAFAMLWGTSWADDDLLPPANPAFQVWPAMSAAKDTPQPKGMDAPLVMAGDEKSPRRAFLLSALVPGAGEFYAGATKRAVGFAVVEAAALGLYLTWNGKGNDIVDEFRATARANWSPRDYLDWRATTRATRYSSITHAMPCSSFVGEVTNSITPEDLAKSLKGCSDRETQQYYELIGKYNQFIAGWKDAKDRDGNQAQPTEIDSVESFSSQIRFAYEDRRNDSNRYLKRAGNVLGLILVNHALSAIDAARAARAHSSGNAASFEERTRFSLVLPPERQRPTMLMAYKPFY